jgi:hypothetical protein
MNPNEYYPLWIPPPSFWISPSHFDVKTSQDEHGIEFGRELNIFGLDGDIRILSPQFSCVAFSMAVTQLKSMPWPNFTDVFWTASATVPSMWRSPATSRTSFSSLENRAILLRL